MARGSRFNFGGIKSGGFYGIYRGFPKLGVHLGVPKIRTIVYLGSILGSPYLGKLPYGLATWFGNCRFTKMQCANKPGIA